MGRDVCSRGPKVLAAGRLAIASPRDRISGAASGHGFRVPTGARRSCPTASRRRPSVLPTGHGVSELLWLTRAGGQGDRRGRAADRRAGDVPVARRARRPADPLSRAIRRAPRSTTPGCACPTRIRRCPGWHRSETLDLMVIIEGDLILGLDDGEYPLGAGAAVVQRGTFHRWRVVGEQPCTFLSVLIAPDPAAGPPVPAVIAPEDARRCPRSRRAPAAARHRSGCRAAVPGAPRSARPASDSVLPGLPGRDRLTTTGRPAARSAASARAATFRGRGSSSRPDAESPSAASISAAGKIRHARFCTRPRRSTSTSSSAGRWNGAGREGSGDHAAQGRRRHPAGDAARWRPVGDERAILVSVMIGLPGSG